MERIDITIIGAGVIGLALAERLSGSFPAVFVLEKNGSFGQETSSRNSEVIHAGIYYPRDSLKSRLCRTGNRLLYDFLRHNRIRHAQVGKYIVASDACELSALESLFRHARASGVEGLEWISTPAELSRRLPHIRCVGAFFSPSSGIFDTHAYMKTLVQLACAHGTEIAYETEFLGCERCSDEYLVTVREPDGTETQVRSRIVINAAGLSADRVASTMGIDILAAGYTLFYCKGEYFRVMGNTTSAVSSLVYPVPQRESLGVHLTPDLAGGLRLGPNATYIEKESADYTVDKAGADDFLRSAQKLMPSLQAADIYPDTAGIRPKLQGPADGFRDFIIAHEEQKGFPGLFSLIGIESPGLTASLAIAEEVAAMIDSYVR